VTSGETSGIRTASLAAAAILIAVIAPLLAQSPPAQGGRRSNIREFLGLGPPPDPVAAERGAPLYAAGCAFCHGANARGGASGPSLVRSVLVLHDEGGNAIGPYLLKGAPEKGMPAFPQLAESQTYDIAQFLHMQIELAANRGTYKRLDIVTGDARRGEAFFNGDGGCSACHSPTGDLAKIGSRLAPDQIQTRFLWPAGGGPGAPPRPRRATVTLPDGTTVTGAIKRLDDFHVSLYDAKGDFHSFSRSGGHVKVEVEDRLKAHRELLDKYTNENMHDLTAYLVTLK
jgi:mono/diheme cytochrome c family protein